MGSSEVYASAALVGAVTGMRSMAGPAVLGKISRNGAFAETHGALGILGKSGFLPLTVVMALGEMVVDKLPFAPNRTAAGPLMGRALIGGISGAAVASARKRSLVAGAVIGAATAIGVAYAAFHLRRKLGAELHLSDTLIALGEDAVVGALGAAVASRF